MNEGPAFHVPLRAKVEGAGRETDVKSTTRAYISMVMGVGVKAGKKVSIEGRWDGGLKPMQKTVAGETSPHATDRSRSHLHRPEQK